MIVRLSLVVSSRRHTLPYSTVSNPGSNNRKSISALRNRQPQYECKPSCKCSCRARDLAPSVIHDSLSSTLVLFLGLLFYQQVRDCLESVSIYSILLYVILSYSRVLFFIISTATFSNSLRRCSIHIIAKDLDSSPTSPSLPDNLLQPIFFYRTTSIKIRRSNKEIVLNYRSAFIVCLFF